jgi:hypothetical protein
VTVRGTFRRDARLVEGPDGTLRLQRRGAARALSIAMVALAAAVGAVDLLIGRPAFAAGAALLTAGFAALLVRAELDRFWFDGRQAVRRWITLRGMAEARVPQKRIARLGVAESAGQARLWIETADGDEIALVEGPAPWVEATAAQLADAMRFAASRPPPGELH